jgi:hypothetical protein
MKVEEGLFEKRKGISRREEGQERKTAMNIK